MKIKKPMQEDLFKIYQKITSTSGTFHGYFTDTPDVVEDGRKGELESVSIWNEGDALHVRFIDGQGAYWHDFIPDEDSMSKEHKKQQIKAAEEACLNYTLAEIQQFIESRTLCAFWDKSRDCICESRIEKMEVREHGVEFLDIYENLFTYFKPFPNQELSQFKDLFDDED